MSRRIQLKLFLGLKKLILTLSILLIFFLSVDLSADFYAKVPEFNPGDGPGSYDLFQPPWYPYDVEEAKNYTVNESGALVKRDEDDDFLKNYGKPKPKAEEILYALKKTSQKLVFEKVLGSPDVIVLDFYGHVPDLAFGLPSGWRTGGEAMRSGAELEFGGYPPIPSTNRMIYDSWVLGVIVGWGYSRNEAYPRSWHGLLVPNLREFAVYLATEGVATANHGALLIERDVNKKQFNPGEALLKALSGQDFKRNVGMWRTKYVDPLWRERKKPYPEKFDTWDDCVKSLVMQDLSSKRVPSRNAFFRLRDIPELSEPIFLEALKKGECTLIMKRNLASLLEGFSSPRAAEALHQLARSEDSVTALRATHSLSRHLHGRVRSLLIDWLKEDQDDMRRGKAILMMGRSQSGEFGQMLMDYFPKAKDDMERELILRSLMRLRHKKARELFEKHLKNDFETIAYTAKLGKLVLGDLSEAQAMEIVDGAFYPDVAAPGSGKIASFATKFRTDLIKWMAHTEMKKPRRRLWKYIKEFNDPGPGAETAGVAHILAYGLYEIELGDEIISKNEAAKSLHLMAARSSTNIQIRLAALSRLYSIDKNKCLEVCHKTIERFLKGRKIGGSSGNKFKITEKDFLHSAINLILIDSPDQDEFINKVMTNPNIGGDSKSLLLEHLFNVRKKTALSVIKKNLKYYTKRANLDHNDERYLVRLIRFAGMFKDPKSLRDVVDLLDKSTDEWIRFVSFYALRLALDSDGYANVISGTAQDRRNVTDEFRKKIKKIR